MRVVELAGHKVGDDLPCFVTFEAGPTHDGLSSALKLIDYAADTGAQAIKFQILDTDRLVSDKRQLFNYSILVSKETNETKAVSEPLYDILKRRELSSDEWKIVREHARKKGLAFFATISYESDLDFLQQIQCDSVKIASADVNHYPLLRLAARTGMCVQIDTGSAEIEEIERAVNVLQSEGCHSIVIHQCPSGYPARLPSICLKMITTLRQLFPSIPIAYSDHTPDADMDIAAVALGANLIEKTITLDRCTPSVEHIFSLEPQDMAYFVRRIRDVETALGSKERILSTQQKVDRKLIRRSPYLTSSYPSGTPLKDISVTFRRPENGITPLEWEDAINNNLKLLNDVKSNQPLRSVDIYEN